MSEMDYKKKYYETMMNLHNILSKIDFSGEAPVVVDGVSFKAFMDKLLKNMETKGGQAVQGHP